MPIPKPNDEEKKTDFISRCAEWMAENEPDLPQKERLGRCYTSWRSKHPGDSKQDWSAVPQSRHEGCGTAEEGATWDAGVMVKEASVAQLQDKMALFEKEDKEVEDDFSFSHHQPDGTLVWDALQGAMGRLNQGFPKGASDDVRREGHSHLAKEYARFGKEAPSFRSAADLRAKLRRSASVQRPCLDPQLQAKEAPSGSGGLRGYLSVFNVRDHWGEVVRPGAFAKSLREKSLWPLMVRHVAYGGTAADVVGSFSAREDSHGLKIDADYLDAPLAQETRQKTDARIVNGLSVGYRELSVSNGEFEDVQVRFMDELALIEGTIVVAPANDMALIESSKSLEGRAVALLKAAYAKGQGRELPPEVEERAKRLMVDLEEAVDTLRGLTSKQPQETGGSQHVDVEARRQRLNLMKARIRMVTQL